MRFMRGRGCICFRSRGGRGRGRGRRYGAMGCCGVFAGVFPKQADVGGGGERVAL